MIIVTQEWKNEHFNVITENEALAIEIELQNGDRFILATICYLNGNPSMRLFRKINYLSKHVMFLSWDHSSNDKQIGCVEPNRSGPILVNITKALKLLYFNSISPYGHTREDPAHGTSNILDMPFIFPWSKLQRRFI